MHPPRVTRYDIAAKTHTVGSSPYPIDHYECGEGWLYLTRPFIGHPHSAAMEAYLLPSLSLQVNRWSHHPESNYAWYDFYVDVMTFDIGEALWTSRDLYLDIVVVEGERAEVLDTDEYLAAVKEGFLTRREAALALTRAHELLNGLAKYGYSLEDYLNAQAIQLKWLNDA